MRCAGITFEENCIKIAVFSKVKNQLTLEKLAEIPRDQLVQEKNLRVVTGLSADEVVRRDLHLKLKRHAALLKALPFQLETVLPFAVEEAIAYPFFYPEKEGTDAVVFATSRAALKNHLEKFDADQVSCVPRALYRWIRLLFPHEKLVACIDANCAIALDSDKIVFSQSFEEKSRIELLFKNKFGHYFRVPEEGPSFQGFSYEQLKIFAVPIGLALEGIESNSCQFRQAEFAAAAEIKKGQLLVRGSLAVSLGLAVLVGGLGGWMLHAREQALHQKIAEHCSASGSLEEKLNGWKKQLVQEARGFPLLPDVPLVKDILGWVGNIQEPIEIVQFHYSLVQYPKAGETEEPYGVKIDLEFKAENPAAARRFREALEQEPTFIDKKEKVSWTAQQNSYKISFGLRKIST
jgi:hypothetical protein